MIQEDAVSDEGDLYLSLPELRRQYTNFVQAKQDEISESRTAWRYYHGAQIDDEQRKVYKDRKQPEIIFNRTARKINGLVGIMQRLRSDPKASQKNPRNQYGAAGAELATAVIRNILESSQDEEDGSFETVEAYNLLAGATHGIGVFELVLTEGQGPDPDISVEDADPRNFFYDPRSVKPGFSDARYMGMFRLVSDDEIEELFPWIDPATLPDVEDIAWSEIERDRQKLWLDERGRKRLVEHWYKRRGEWFFCFYIGSSKLMEGVSPFPNGKGGTTHRYVPWSAAVDHDGDRYGLPRILKGPQDQLNFSRSKSQHLSATRQIIARQGAFADADAARRQAHLPDGFLEYQGDRGDFEIVQPTAEFLQQVQLFQEAGQEIESLGPSVSMVDTGAQATSGRALAMLQQNGLAELGPFVANFRAARLRLYKKVYNAAVEHKKAEWWIRVSTDDETAEFIGVNVMQVGEDGLPQIINSLGSIDVDIGLDEGPDTMTVMGDVFDLMLSLAQNGVPIDPRVILEASNLPKSVKDKLTKMLDEPKPPSPEQQAGMVLELAGKKAEVEKITAEGEKIRADTAATMREMMLPPDDGGGAQPQGVSIGDAMTNAAKAEESRAAADLKRAQAAKIVQDIQMAPIREAQKLNAAAIRSIPRENVVT